MGRHLAGPLPDDFDLGACSGCGRKADHECGGCFRACCKRKGCRDRHAACATPDELADP